MVKVGTCRPAAKAGITKPFVKISAKHCCKACQKFRQNEEDGRYKQVCDTDVMHPGSRGKKKRFLGKQMRNTDVSSKVQSRTGH